MKTVLSAALSLAIISSFAWAEGPPPDFRPGNPVPPGWWPSLTNQRKDVCCSGYDGADVQWDYGKDGYVVFLLGQWWDVPPHAVVTVPNLHGRATIWANTGFNTNGEPVVQIRCFLPGAGL